MPEYKGPEDIYRELVEESDENWLYGLVAFAVIEEQRIEWMKHMQENTGRLPTPEQVSEWYQQQPPNCLLRAKGTAENALQLYSRSEEHTSELQSRENLVCRLLLEKKKTTQQTT